MDFEYIIANNQVTIIKYTGSSKDVTIPNEIENLPVTVISYSAFSRNKLTSINLPQNLTTIRQSAFYNNELTSISLPQNLTILGEYAFGWNCLTSISLPQNLTAIGGHAFIGNKLTSISLPHKFRTDGQIQNIFDFSLEELDNKNKKFIKPCLDQILEDYSVNYHFHDIIVDYMIPSNELVREAIEAYKN
jgi:hypothetical protein